jgi:hypothetical protein
VAKPKPAPATKPRPREEAEDGMVSCENCGKDIKSSWRKCPFCGQEQ